MAPLDDSYSFDAFLSYASGDSFDRVRATKLFLESFHTRVVTERTVPALHVCVDGIDFRLPHSRSTDASPSGTNRSALRQLVAEHLRLCRRLVVFGSPAASHPSGWVQWEVEEFVYPIRSLPRWSRRCPA